jgi:hypothetical protein
MPHQDTDGHTHAATHGQDLELALVGLIGPGDVAGIRFRADCTWTPLALLHAALLWAWSDGRALTERFTHAREVVADTACSPHAPATTYQAFLRRLGTWSDRLAAALIAALRRRMRDELAGRWTCFGFAVFGADGSRLDLPRTRSNEAAYAAASARADRQAAPRRGRPPGPRAAAARRARRKKAEAPQMWLTTAFHAGTGLPWAWRIGPSGSSERGHLREMLDELPEGALITADAGFAGYETWRAITDGGRHLLIRVGSNVRLLEGLGYAVGDEGLVSLWPEGRAAAGEPPLVLRLVVVEAERDPVYLVTSVTDEARLSDEAAAAIYRLRWGAELFYRHFKQTFGRRKLRSHRAEHAAVEATWSLLGLWAMGLHAQCELAGVPAGRVSVAGVLRAFGGAMREHRCEPRPGGSLRERLGRAIIDPYRRANKSSRDYPRKKRHRKTGPPQLQAATPDQIEAARALREAHASRLTA